MSIILYNILDKTYNIYLNNNLNHGLLRIKTILETKM